MEVIGLPGFEGIYPTHGTQILREAGIIHTDINDRKGRHSWESGNPGKDWIPSQARNDKLERTYVVMYNIRYVKL